MQTQSEYVAKYRCKITRDRIIQTFKADNYEDAKKQADGMTETLAKMHGGEWQIQHLRILK